MNTINDQLMYQRLSNMGTSGAPIKPAAPSKDNALQNVSSDFEALFFKEMMSSMRKANDVLAEGNPFSSREQEFMRDWHDDELARSLAAGGGIGLADELVEQTERFTNSSGS